MKNIENEMADNARRDFEEKIPLFNKKVTLIVVSNSGRIYASKAISGKVDLIENIEKGDQPIIVWTGEWSTDAFIVTIPELKKLHKIWINQR